MVANKVLSEQVKVEQAVKTPARKLRRHSLCELGQSKERWPRIGDSVRPRASSWVMGSVAERVYRQSLDLKSLSPGPIYNPKLDYVSPGLGSGGSPLIGYMGTAAHRNYIMKSAMSHRSPGPIYDVKTAGTSEDLRPKGGFMATVAARVYSETNKTDHSPGPIYNTSRNVTAGAIGGQMGSNAQREYEQNRYRRASTPGAIYNLRRGCHSRDILGSSYSIVPRRPDTTNKWKAQVPGPRYNYNYRKLSKFKGSGQFAMGKDGLKKKRVPSPTPGPGQYFSNNIPRFIPKSWGKPRKTIAENAWNSL